MFNGVVWAEFKLLVGVALILSFDPSSCSGKVGAYAIGRLGRPHGQPPHSKTSSYAPAAHEQEVKLVGMTYILSTNGFKSVIFIGRLPIVLH